MSRYGEVSQAISEFYQRKSLKGGPSAVLYWSEIEQVVREVTGGIPLDGEVERHAAEWNAEDD